MPNSKQINLKKKHRKNQQRLKDRAKGIVGYRHERDVVNLHKVQTKKRLKEILPDFGNEENKDIK